MEECQRSVAGSDDVAVGALKVAEDEQEIVPVGQSYQKGEEGRKG